MSTNTTMPPPVCENCGRDKQATYICDACVNKLNAMHRTLAAEVDELRGKLDALGEPRICLNCGRNEPCELKDDPCTPCLFDPDYATCVQMWKDARAETRELQAKLDDVRMGIGCARGQRTTQYCAEAAQRDEVITKLLAQFGEITCDPSCGITWTCTRCQAYARACEIAGRTE